jgi:thiol-disulfide isomerase/thioredoxin
MSKLKTGLIYAVVAIMFAVLGIRMAQRGHSDGQPASAATPAQKSPLQALFAASLADQNGQMQPLAHWRGKPLIVNFWASWCAPCVKEMPELMALATEMAPHGLQTIGIGIDNASNIREFSAKYHITYPLLEAGVQGSELSRQLGNASGGLPFTVLIGRNGEIKKTYLGLLKFEQLRLDIAQEIK